jgi:hypothetical protein
VIQESEWRTQNIEKNQNNSSSEEQEAGDNKDRQPGNEWLGELLDEIQ